MEFKFRAVDYRHSNYFPPPTPPAPAPAPAPPPPPSSAFFNPLSSQGFRPSPNFNGIQPNPHFNQIQPTPNFYQFRPDPIRELEKAQIREEIIASEIARRRTLEAEVRMELMVEWEMAARYRACETGSFSEPRLTMPLNPRLPFMHHHLNFDNQNSWRPPAPSNWFPSPPPPPPTPPPPPLPRMFSLPVTEILNPEVKDTSNGNKNKLIKLAKPDPNRIVGAKWKTPLPALLVGTSELSLPLISLKNKPDEEWSCAICQVTVTNEKVFNDHLQGKKHKKKEARLKAERMEKNFNTTTLPKKLRQSDQKLEFREKLKNTKDEQPSKGDEKAESIISITLPKKLRQSDQKLEYREKLKNTKDEQLNKGDEKAESIITTTLPKKLSQSDQKLEYGEKLKNTKDEQPSKGDEKAESIIKKKQGTMIDKVEITPEIIIKNNIKDEQLSKKDEKAESIIEKKQGPTAIDKVEIAPEIIIQKNAKYEQLSKRDEKVEITPKIIIKKKQNFWCEMCSVGAPSEVVMESHMKGKKHIARLRELDKNDAASPATTTTNTVTEQAGSNGTQMSKVPDAAADEANEKLMDAPEADGYIFWCQLCLVGSHSEMIMEEHKQGRRHIARLLEELDKNNAASPSTTTTDDVAEQAKI